MTSKEAPTCSDAELLKELKKLGYNDIAPDVFQLMKEDISKLVKDEQYLSEVPSRRERTLSSSTIVKYSRAHIRKPNIDEDAKTKYAGKLKSQLSQESRMSTEPNISDGSSLEKEDDRYAKYRNRFSAFKLDSFSRKSTEDTDSPIISTETSSSSLSRNYARLQNKYEFTGKLPEIVKPREPERNLASSLQDSEEDPLTKYRRRFKLGALSERPDAVVESAERSRTVDNIVPTCSRTVDNIVPTYSRTVDNIVPVPTYSRTVDNAVPTYSRTVDNTVPTGSRTVDGIVPTCSRTVDSVVSTCSRSVDNVVPICSEESVIVSGSENKMKRKVLRRRDGKPVITEEILDMPSIFNTSYPETETGTSFSSDDLSWKSNGSTGSVLSPETTHSASQSSYSTPRSLHNRIAVQRKKKTDPVTMYNYYKNYWNNFKPPGEKTHDKLRWAVRDRMLDYNV